MTWYALAIVHRRLGHDADARRWSTAPTPGWPTATARPPAVNPLAQEPIWATTSKRRSCEREAKSK